jgi:nucleoside-diphosphate-sugar epimerase
MVLPRVLVTGSKDKIGTVLMEALADSFEVYGVDIMDTGGERTFRADSADYEQLSKFVAGACANTVYSSPCC